MSDFFSDADQALLRALGLDSFEALWELQLDSVDAPNACRGGSSSVFRLVLGERVYYLKRQSNYLMRTLRHPFGEPTFACEFRNIQRYQRMGIPAPQAAFFGARRVGGEWRAILLTRALEGWRDLHEWLTGWDELDETTRHDVLHACGQLARQLHEAGERHGCFYPKHIFLRPGQEGFEACLIDLEKTRPLRLAPGGRINDLEALTRRAKVWCEQDLRILLGIYLDRDRSDSSVDGWLRRLARRRQRKESRA